MRFAALACLGGLMLISAPLLAGHAVAQTTGPAPAKAARGKAAAPQGEAAKADPAAAERALEAGIKAYEAGKNEQAAQVLSGAMQGGALPGPKMARALYYRGLAYKKSGKPAQAISDLTSALWLKGGLSETERTDALAQREAAYQEAGIAQAPAVTTAAAKASAATPGASRAAAASAAPPPPPAPAAIATAAVTGNPVDPPAAPKEEKSGGFFSNLFGSSSSSPAPAAAGAPPSSAPAPEPAASSWSSASKQSTGVKPTTPAPAAPAKPAAKVAAAAATAAPAAAPPPAAGNYRLQVAAVRSRAEAEAVAAKLKKEFSKKLGNRQAVIDEAAIGNMGTFYRVRVGPYASANEPRQLCITLRASGGYDCMVVTQ